MFLHYKVDTYPDWSTGQGSANPIFFAQVFKVIKTCVENDNDWPYDLAADGVQVLLDIVQSKITEMARVIRPKFVLDPPDFRDGNQAELDGKMGPVLHNRRHGGWGDQS